MKLPKQFPYFGLGSMFFCSFPELVLLLTSLYLSICLGLGRFVSTLAKSQFVAAQFALVLGFLPAVQPSGSIFEISSMPRLFRGRLTCSRRGIASEVCNRSLWPVT